MIKTGMVATKEFLLKLFSMEPDEELDDVCSTHDGQWREEGDNLWRFWKHEDID